MNTSRVDIIIPVYNVEPYLRRCLNSVFSTTENKPVCHIMCVLKLMLVLQSYCFLYKKRMKSCIIQRFLYLCNH